MVLIRDRLNFRHSLHICRNCIITFTNLWICTCSSWSSSRGSITDYLAGSNISLALMEGGENKMLSHEQRKKQKPFDTKLKV